MPLYIYERPRPEAAYVYGLDPSSGRGGDPAALVVTDAVADPPREVLLFRSQSCGYRDLAQLAIELHAFGYKVVRGRSAKGYERSGGLVPEANNEALMDALHERFGDAFFFQQRRQGTPTNPEGALLRFGFWSTGASKRDLLDHLREALESRAFRQSDRFLGMEAPYWDRTGDKWEFKPPAISLESTGHGDVTYAHGLAWEGCLAVREWLPRSLAQAWAPAPPPARSYISIGA